MGRMHDRFLWTSWRVGSVATALLTLVPVRDQGRTKSVERAFAGIPILANDPMLLTRRMGVARRRAFSGRLTIFTQSWLGLDFRVVRPLTEWM